MKKMRTFFEWIEEVQNQLDEFIVYQNMTDIPQEELVKEYNEEIAPTMQKEKDCQARWGIDSQTAQSIFGDLNNFLQLVKNAQVQTLPPSVLRNVRNYSQVTSVIDNYASQLGHNPQAELQNQNKFFKSIDPQNGSGGVDGIQQSPDEVKRQQTGGYTKAQSFDHKIGLVQGNNPINYPLLLFFNNEYSHISGATRQTAAVTNKIILPVKVIK